jgi:hypothetical protein
MRFAEAGVKPVRLGLISVLSASPFTSSRPWNFYHIWVCKY